MNDEKKTLGRVFIEGLAFGSGLVIAGGALKMLWNAVTSKDEDDNVDDDVDYEPIEGD